jgi:hypothetical protein
MLTFAIILALVSFTFEMIFASKIKAWRQFASRYKLANLFMSLGLSYTLGTLFGAGGLIAMTAAILATLISIPGYAALDFMLDSPTANRLNGNVFGHYWQKFSSVMRDFFILIYKIMRIITFPVRAVRSVVIFTKSVFTFFSRRKATA